MGKIREFFRKLFGRNKVLALEQETSQAVHKKMDIREALKVDEHKDIRKLQEKYESGLVQESSLSNSKLKSLIQLYETQIKELDYRISLS